MPLDEIYQLTHAGTLRGELVENVYFYRVDTGTPSALNIAQAFIQDVQPKILDVLTSNIVFNRVNVINLGSLTDFHDAVVNAPGDTTTDMMTPEDAVNFTLRLDTRAVRPGSKRYSAIAVSAQDAGVIDDAPYIALLNVLAVALGSPIGYPTEPEATYKPIVVKRVPYVTSEGNDSYRLPISDVELVFGNVTGVLVNLELSHQDTRGNGQ